MESPILLLGWWLAAIGAPASSRAWAIVLGIVFAIIAISLLVASWTRWGQTKPLAKCVGIAVLAHIWLLMYAYGTRIVSPGFGPGADGGIQAESGPPATFAWQGPLPDPTPLASQSADAPVSDTDAEPSNTPTPAAQPWDLGNSSSNFEQVDAPKLPQDSISSDASLFKDRFAEERNPLDDLFELPADRSESELLSMADLPVDPALPPPDSQVAPQRAPPPSPPNRTAVSMAHVPPMYRMRLAPNRSQAAANAGGDARTETAVENALAWLARAQSEDGSWNAQQHGAGRDLLGTAAPAEGQYRANAGRRADTAMTGLALLAFLGAGHTHREGPYAETVNRGIQYLLAQQFPSGDLSGRSQVGQDPTVRYARMYSHGMAGLAIAEAYAMSQDATLLPTLQSAAAYSIHAMNARSGGWRYDFASDDPGDTSQFGWQAMFLHSASKSRAIQLSGPHRLALQRFLDSVSTGRHGGLAVYRNVVPGSQPSIASATPAMTAEAMAMRCMLELPISTHAQQEARDMLLSNLPGRSQENLYYWYYGALTMFQLRNQQAYLQASYPSGLASSSEAAWQQWNQAMKQQLCGSQLTHGPEAGSWNPTCIWGSYGGRVYSTAMACMCLEVYYRYLPMYHELAREPIPSALSK